MFLRLIDGDLRATKANTVFCDAFAANRGKAEGQLVYDIGGGEWDLPELRDLLEDIIP